MASDYTKFKGTNEERVAWMNATAKRLIDGMRANLLIKRRKWLDYQIGYVKTKDVFNDMFLFLDDASIEGSLSKVKEKCSDLFDSMNDNLLVKNERGDYDWLDYIDIDENIDTYDTISEISRFIMILQDDLVEDYFSHKGWGADGFID